MTPIGQPTDTSIQPPAGAPPMTGAAAPSASPAPVRRRSLGRVRWLVLVLAASVGAGTGAALALHHQQTSLADVMSLSPLPLKAAPRFTLTDQTGAPLSLSQFHGKVVVLEFMDPRCTDICPIVSQEFRVADRDLGRAAAGVEFMAINVNQDHEDVASIRQFGVEQHLDQLPNWHFLTGSTAQLKSQWLAYGETVDMNPAGDVVHTSLMYFIDPNGYERYVAIPLSTTVDQAQWGRGIAQYARDLLQTR